MKSERYLEEFKIEAIKQVAECAYSVAEVAQRLDTTTHSLYLDKKSRRLTTLI